MSGRCRLMADCVAKVVLHWDQKFCGRQARLSRKDVRDLIASRKTQGDFGNAIEIIRIVDCFPFRVFAKNSLPCNFRLLQHNRHEADIPVECAP